LYQSRIIPARYRIGIFHPYHKGFFHYLIRLDFYQHIIEKNIAIFNFLNIPITKEESRPYLPEGNISEEIKSFASKISKLQCIGINLSAGEKDREWSLHKWIELLKGIDENVVIFATQDRNEDKQKLENMFKHVIVSPVTKSIFEAGHILQHLKLLISPDTALIHIASCYNISVVGLYRAQVEHITRFYPYLIPNKTLVSATRRIEDISVSQVVEAVELMIDKEHHSPIQQKFSND
jgi:ADP-heptose:LPS heptosyltransferase